ncbi:MAG: hypothetical protein AB9866_09165 [Syntrophobacteraceae bacterium]
MNRIFNLTILAVAFALVIGFGAFSTTMAASDNFNWDYPGQVNLIGIDEANNSLAGHADRDRGVPGFTFDTYGLAGNYADHMER